VIDTALDHSCWGYALGEKKRIESVKPLFRLLLKRMQFKPITAIIVLLLVVASLLVSGCTTTNNTATNEPTTSDMSVTVKSVALSQQDQLAANKPGYKFVAYNCTVNNTGTKSRPVGYNSWELRDMQGGVYAPALATNVSGTVWSRITNGNWWNPTTSNPRDVLRGIVVFEVPQNATLTSLTYNDGVTKIVTTL